MTLKQCGRIAGVALVIAVLLQVVPAAAQQEEPAYLSPKDVPRITKDELKSKLGSPDIIVIDVRLPGLLKPGEPKIVGALAENPKEAKSWLSKYPKDKTIILYCS